MKGKLDILVAKTKPFYFVSYNSEDAGRVSSACKILQSLGVPLWCDNDVAYGDEWEQVIGEKIDESTAVILFITKGIFDKPKSFVRKEFDVAEFYGKPIYVVFLDTIGRSSIPHGFALWWSSIEKLQNCLLSHFNSLEEAMEDFGKGLGFTKKESPGTGSNSQQLDDDEEGNEYQPSDEEKLRNNLIHRIYETDFATAGMVLYLASRFYTKNEDLARYNLMSGTQIIAKLKPLLVNTIYKEDACHKDRLLRRRKSDRRLSSAKDVLRFIHQDLFLNIALLGADYCTEPLTSLNFEIDTKTPYRYLKFPFYAFPEEISLCFNLCKRNDGSADDYISLTLNDFMPRLDFHCGGGDEKFGTIAFRYDCFFSDAPEWINWMAWVGRENDPKELIEKDEKDIKTALPYLLQEVHRFFLYGADTPGGLKALFPHYEES